MTAEEKLNLIRELCRVLLNYGEQYHGLCAKLTDKICFDEKIKLAFHWGECSILRHYFQPESALWNFVEITDN